MNNQPRLCCSDKAPTSRIPKTPVYQSNLTYTYRPSSITHRYRSRHLIQPPRGNLNPALMALVAHLSPSLGPSAQRVFAAPQAATANP